jgi:hypothetical protein
VSATEEQVKAFLAQQAPRRTALSAKEEAEFQRWYKGWAQRAELDPNPDSPLHKYDYRGAFKAKEEPQVDSGDGLYHWSSRFKDPDHPNRYVNGVDTKATDTPRGASEADVVAFLRGNTNRPSAEGEAAEAKKLKRESQTLDHNSFSNKLRMLFQGATLRFGDEAIGAAAAAVPGGKGYREARDDSRERVEALRNATPGMAAVMEGVGGLLLPGGVATKAATKLGGVAGTALLGAEGGVIGGLFGAGDAPEGERLQSAKVPAVAGAATGAAAPLLSILPRMVGSSNKRVAEELVKRSGLENNINKAIAKADEAIQGTRKKYYGALELKYPGAIDDPQILKVVQSDALAEHARAIDPALVARKRGKKVDPARSPTLTELQSLRTRLRKKDPDLAKQLSDVMSKSLEGLDAADAEWARVVGNRRSFEIGRGTVKDKKTGLYARTSADTERILEKLPAEAQEGVRKGRLHEIVVKLQRRDSDSVALLKDYMDAGEETQKVLRQVFPDDKSFKGFMAVLAKEKRAAVVAREFKRYAPLAAVGGAGGIGAAAFMK